MVQPRSIEFLSTNVQIVDGREFIVSLCILKKKGRYRRSHIMRPKTEEVSGDQRRRSGTFEPDRGNKGTNWKAERDDLRKRTRRLYPHQRLICGDNNRKEHIGHNIVRRNRWTRWYRQQSAENRHGQCGRQKGNKIFASCQNQIDAIRIIYLVGKQKEMVYEGSAQAGAVTTEMFQYVGL